MSRRARWIVVPALSLAALFLVIFVVFLYWTRHGAGSDGPRVGLSVSTFWYDRMQFHRAAYDMALGRAGVNVVTVEPQDGPSIEKLLDGLDGIVLAGGGDVDPELFGGEPGRAKLVDRERDDFELDLIRRASKRGIPVLGICRGCQILAVAHGGTLKQLEGKEAERHGITLKSLSAHDVKIEPGTRLHGIVGDELKGVSSFHAQAVETTGKGLVAAARGEDGVIEAVERPGEPFLLGIQWHSELEAVGDSDALAPIRAFVEAAKAYRAKRDN